MNDEKLAALVVQITGNLAQSREAIAAKVLMTKYVAATVLFSVAAIIVGLSVSQVVRQYYKSVARQPEIKDALASNIYIFTGMIDAFAAIAACAAFILLFGNAQPQLSVRDLGQEVYSLIQNASTKSVEPTQPKAQSTTSSPRQKN